MVNEIVGWKFVVVNVSLELMIGLGDVGLADLGLADGDADGSDAPQAAPPTTTNANMGPANLLNAILLNSVPAGCPELPQLRRSSCLVDGPSCHALGSHRTEVRVDEELTDPLVLGREFVRALSAKEGASLASLLDTQIDFRGT
jgi:hypothetical protein